MISQAASADPGRGRAARACRRQCGVSEFYLYKRLPVARHGVEAATPGQGCIGAHKFRCEYGTRAWVVIGERHIELLLSRQLVRWRSPHVKGMPARTISESISISGSISISISISDSITPLEDVPAHTAVRRGRPATRARRRSGRRVRRRAAAPHQQSSAGARLPGASIV